jgi:hypothetical protein
MTDTFRQELEASLSKVASMGNDIRAADFSKWPAYPSAAPRIHELQNDPTYTSIRDIDGMVFMLLASFEHVLSAASHERDSAKAFQRFRESLIGDGVAREEYTRGALSAGVLDTAVEIGLVSESEADVLKAKRPWHEKFTPAQAADHVDDLVGVIRAVCARIDGESAVRRD